MALSSRQLEELVGDRGEFVFNWSTRDGYLIGVVMAYIHRDGKFWTNCAARRKRVSALRARPKCSIVIASAQQIASFTGTALIHAHEDPDWEEVKTWFYAAVWAPRSIQTTPAPAALSSSSTDPTKSSSKPRPR